jgi:hypothetical protein
MPIIAVISVAQTAEVELRSGRLESPLHKDNIKKVIERVNVFTGIKVGRCRLTTVSQPVLKSPMVSVFEATT